MYRRSVDDDEHLITCGSVIKIQHKDTGYYLNSEEKQLGEGSGQQIVTFVSDPATHNTLWWVSWRCMIDFLSLSQCMYSILMARLFLSQVRPAEHGFESGEYGDTANCKLAGNIACGSIVRLTHSETLRNLHSHAVESVLSRQQEITGYGTGDGRGDGGDNWKVECGSSKDKYWTRNSPFRLRHVDTQKVRTSATVDV